MTIRIILNGKKAALPAVRAAINSARSYGGVEVRVTWEAGDVERLVKEACREGCQRLIAAGGDGTVNEMVNALMQRPAGERPELAIMPLGTANDFASACTIPDDLESALKLAMSGSVVAIDCIRANEHHFINVASGGFGAQVTTNTPVALKNFLGGGAYTLSGLVQALNFVPFAGELSLPGQSLTGDIIVGAVCNGRQAGGGQQLAPHAFIDDGLLDLVALQRFPPDEFPRVLKELSEPETNGNYVKRFRVPWAQWTSEIEMPLNLDGEPVKAKTVRFELVPAAIKLVLPPHCPLLKRNHN